MGIRPWVGSERLPFTGQSAGPVAPDLGMTGCKPQVVPETTEVSFSITSGRASTSTHLTGTPVCPVHFGFFAFFFFLGLHLRHMEVPRLGVKLELQLLAYTTAIATRDPRTTGQGQGSNPYPYGY